MRCLPEAPKQFWAGVTLAGHGLLRNAILFPKQCRKPVERAPYRGMHDTTKWKYSL